LFVQKFLVQDYSHICNILFYGLRFLENEDDIAKLRKCFAGLWSLDNPEGVNGAMERPELFVLKPQREGGG